MPLSEAAGRDWGDGGRIVAVVAAFQVLIPLICLAFPASIVLHKSKCRLGRLGASALSMPGLDALFHESENAASRQYVYWTSNALVAIALAPLLAALGATSSLAAYYPQVGCAALLCGSAILSGGVGLLKWRYDRWRLTQATLSLVASAVVALLAFCVFVSAFVGIDVRGFTLAMLTISLAPLALEAFESDSKAREATSAVGEALGAAARNSGEAWLLADVCSAHADHEAFDYVGDVAGVLNGFGNRVDATATARKRAKLLRWASRFSLVVYVVIAFWRTDRGGLAIVNSILIATLDSCHALLARGSQPWGPTRTVGLAAFARVFVALGGAEFWVAGHAAAFLLYGVILAQDVVHRHLPLTQQHDACAVVFHGREPRGIARGEVARFDVAGLPEVVLAMVIFVLMFQVITVGFMEPHGLHDRNATIKTARNRRTHIPDAALAVVALFAVAAAGLASASVRAAALAGQDLLVGAGDLAYFFDAEVRLPRMLAFGAYAALMCNGLYLWGATGSVAALAVATLGPLLLALSGRALYVWHRNDCRLVVWPPLGLKMLAGDAVSDSDLAFDVLQAIIGKDKDPGADNVSTLELAPLERNAGDTDAAISRIEMPMLPPSNLTRQLAGPAQTGRAGAKVSAQPREPALPAAYKRAMRFDLGFRALRLKKVTVTSIGAPVPVKSSFRWRSKGSKGAGEAPQQADVAPAAAAKDAVRKKALPSLTLWEVTSHLAHHVSNLARRKRARVSDSSAAPDWDEVRLWEAALTGCLLPAEYEAICAAFSAPLLLVALAGSLALTLRPRYVGAIVLLVGLTLACTVVPIVQWFTSRRWSRSTNAIVICGACAFAALLGVSAAAQDGLEEALWVVDAAVLYPVALSGAYAFLEWRASGWRAGVAAPMRSKRGRAPAVASVAWARHSRIWVLVLVSMQFFWFSSPYAGGVLLLGTGLVLGARNFVEAWAQNDFEISKDFLKSSDAYTRRIEFLLVIVLLFATRAPTDLVVSLFFAVELCGRIVHVLARWLLVGQDDLFWFPKTLLPAYSFSSREGKPVSQTALVLDVCRCFGVGIFWGATLAALQVAAGVFVLCLFLLGALFAAVAALTVVPARLGRAARSLGHEVFVDAADAARAAFCAEILAARPLQAVCKEWDVDGNVEAFASEGAPTARSTSVGRVDVGASAAVLARAVDDDSQALYFIGDVRRSDALFQHGDAVAEAAACKGPFAPLFLCVRCAGRKYLKAFEEHGRRLNTEKGSGLLEAVLAMVEADEVFDDRLEVEVRCCAFFHLAALRAAEANLRVERSLFEKFTRERRFQLLANGVSPPRLLVASGDAQPLANWLLALTDDERERFRVLQKAFRSDEDHRSSTAGTHACTLSDDNDAERKRLEPREKLMLEARKRDAACRKQARTDAWLAALGPADASRFEVFREAWETGVVTESNVDETTEFDETDVDASSASIASSADFADLKASYDVHVCVSGDSVRADARERLSELEGGQDVQASKHHANAFQYVDPDFPPTNDSLGRSGICRAWEVASEVKFDAVLYRGEVDADDVQKGCLVKNSWLLTAIRLIASTSSKAGQERHLADEIVRNLLVHAISEDGEPINDSAVGAFAFQLYIAGQWQAIIVDDALPMVGNGSLDGYASACKEFGLNFDLESSAGVACAYSSGFNDIWISLLEKAVAKYYGSYDALEQGSVHRGLEMLTGARSERISLTVEGRSADENLWSSLLRFKRDECIVGANAVRRNRCGSLRDSGLLFGETYGVMDVRTVNGHRLVLLRTPGAFSNGGALGKLRGKWAEGWSPRMKFELGGPRGFGNDPKAFWVSFQELIDAFECLYVCHYHSPKSDVWTTLSASGKWSVSGNTAAGLPSKRNPNSDVERNPQFVLHVTRPTSLRCTLTQEDGFGVRSTTLPVSLYLVRATADNGAVSRVRRLSKTDVVSSSGDPRIAHTVFLEADRVEAGVYVIYCATYAPNLQGPFTLTVVADKPCDLEQLWPPPWRGRRPAVDDGAEDAAVDAPAKRRFFGKAR
ncbi:hypothetical protein M885DRAFT_526155 [Pelagophyceae sp. CCMP2097]|nr:hypothetical protein M885DRAFT_526155 [Pelagophyceae sp. CCMP2097]